MSRPPRVLVLGWSSVVHGEATAGDVLSMRAVEGALAAAGIAVDVAWSPVMATAPGAGGVLLQDADPAAYTAVVWACGPLHGAPVREVLDRFAGCRRLAVGVSVVDPDDPAVTGWDAVWARDAPGAEPVRDLAAGPAAAWGSGAPSSTGAHLPWPRPELGHGHAHDHAHGHAHDHAHGHDHGHGQRPVPGAVPVVGVYVAPGQAEYGVRRRHDAVLAALGEWGPASGAARVALDTRLDPRGWRDPDAPGQVLALAERCDAVVSMRLHGMVLALARGVPVVALDPVAGGGKVAAQAAAWGWRAVLTADAVTPAAVQAQLAWCLAAEGRAAAARARAEAPAAGAADLAAVVAAVQDRLPVVARTTGTH